MKSEKIMKKIMFTLVILFITMNNSLIAQKISQKESELKPLLCIEWEIEYANLGAIKIGKIPGAKDFDMKFRPDGTYDIIKDDGETNTGNWKYYLDKKYVELEINGTITSRITYIDKNKLVLIMTSEDNGPSGMAKIETHFKPKK